MLAEFAINSLERRRIPAIRVTRAKTNRYPYSRQPEARQSASRRERLPRKSVRSDFSKREEEERLLSTDRIDITKPNLTTTLNMRRTFRAARVELFFG